MIPDIQRERHKAHDYVDRLPDAQVSAACALLEAMLLPNDDEPVTEGDRRRVLEGRRWFAEHGGKGAPMEDVLADHGLSVEDFPLSK